MRVVHSVGPAALGLFVQLVGCASDGLWGNVSDSSSPANPKVLFVGIDGLRGDGVSGSTMPRLDAIMREGAWTRTASTQLHARTVSGPGWASMLTGVDANKHGISRNGGWEGMDRSYPTLIGRSHELGLRTATAINWLPIQMMLIEPGSTDAVSVGSDGLVAEEMVSRLENEDFDVHFVAFDDVDRVGHQTGFTLDNPAYVEAIELTDERVGWMLDAIGNRANRKQEDWLVLVTSDHGGSGTSHGALDEDCRTIPLIVWGDSVSPSIIPPGEGSHLDIHPTVMAHLGYRPKESWLLDGTIRGSE